MNEVSFSIPQRKKFTLTVFRQSSSSEEHLLSVSPAGASPIYEISTRQIAHAFKLPVPEKTQKQWNYIILPQTSCDLEPLLWTITDGPIKVAYANPERSDNSSISSLDTVLSESFHLVNLRLIQPEDDQFVSSLRESHRKQDSCYHVKAHRGSKDGYLFFLSTGVFFGFKKPLMFLSLSDIDSISYTSVLQRTFNLNIAYREGEEEKEVEFSMLDQADYSGIDTYVKRHGLNDASLAEGRRAKLHNVNKARPAQMNGEDGPQEEDDGRTELEKAEQQLQDEEDEMEEDFELESGDGDSDGSGGSEDEDEYEGGDGDGNLIDEELGSEAEDVEEENEDEDEEGDGEQEEDDVEDEPQIDHHAPQPAKSGSRMAPIPSRQLHDPDPDDEDQL